MSIVPNDFDDVTATASKNKKITVVWIAFEHFLDNKREAPGSLSSYPYGRSPATRAHTSGSESSALQNIEHPTKRIRIDIGVDANPFAITEINFDQPCLLRRKSGQTRRLFCRRRRHRTQSPEMALVITRKSDAAALARQLMAPALATPGEDQAAANPMPTSHLRILAPGAKVSSVIRAFSSSDHRRRRSTPFKISTRIDCDLKYVLKVTWFADLPQQA